ncbi:hypothetical protein BSL78_01863 [Apostichopus japonicus]|uniref:Uncharacterized protein n=1 Tax=Stichopus japonicus TaxID=307972 RepID=A0A2G8LM24_STIJA|nr:hypothetical protein BSL78_01863 [Apostichopus japonicus]
MSMLDEYIRNDVTIDAVAITTAASPNLVELTTSTGGRLYLQTDSPSSTGLRDALNANSGGAAISDFGTRVQLQLAVAVFGVGDRRMQGSVVIDETVGRLTTFEFTYFHPNPPGRAAVSITVTSPSGQTFHRFSQVYEDDLAFKKVIIRIPDIAEPGEWRYVIYNQDTTVAHDVIVSIASYLSQEGVDPIIISSFLCGLRIGVDNNKEVVVYADVRRRFFPVVGSTVIATVETPIGVPVELQLNDNGAGM